MAHSSNLTPALSRKAEYEEKAQLISRKFSTEVGDMMPNNPIAHAMAAAEATREAKESQAIKIFQDLQTEATLPASFTKEFEQAIQKMMDARSELSDAMMKQGSSKKERVMPTVFPSNDGPPEKENNTPDKIAKALGDTIAIIDRFKEVFNFIPIDNDYVHVVIGVLKTISDATLNHRKIGKGFRSAIEKIGREMQYCGDMLATADQSSLEAQRIKLYVAKFFSKVFAFLIPYTKWCASSFKRFTSAFDSDFYASKVKGPLDEILDEVRRLEREGNLQARKDILAAKKAGEDVQRMVRSLVEKQEKRDARQVDTKNSDDIKVQLNVLQLAVGQLGNQFTEIMARTHFDREGREREDQERAFGKDSQKPQQLSDPWTTVLKPANNSKPAAIAATEKALRFVDVEVASRHLEVTVKNGYPINFLATPEDMPMASQIFQRLQKWMSTSHSERLWLHGPAYTPVPSPVSLAAASIVLVSEQNKVNLIAYRIHIDDFVSSDTESVSSLPPYDETQSSPELDRMVMMVYSLIRQMIWLLPDNVDTKADFSFERFYLLNGSIDSLPEAYNIFEDLLALMPSLFLCIIDGIQLIDGGRYDDQGLGSTVYFDKFLEILWKAEKNRTMKVLLVSDGLCPTLLCEENIRMEEEFCIEEDLSQGQTAEFWEVFEDTNFSN